MTDSIHRRRLDSLVETTAARIVEQALHDGLGVADLPGMKLRWYRIGETRAVRRSADEVGTDAPTTTEANVYVYDRIGGSLGVNAKQFAADLEEINADVIHLRVNSVGGAVFDGKAIMNTLRAHPARVIGHVDGIAASAATVVLMGSDEIVVEPGGELMVHKATTTADGDDDILGTATKWIRRQSEDLAELYAQRSGRSADEWMEMMTAETWFYGQEAVTVGLADRAETLTRPTYDDPEVEERMRRRHSLAEYRFQGRIDAGAPGIVRKAHAGRGSRSRHNGVTAEIRDAGKLRRHANGQGMVRRSAPAGVTTMARCSAPDGQIQRRTVEHRGREMYQTDGYFTVYGRGYEMWDMYGPYQEEVVQGAGAVSLAGKPDTNFLINHTGLALARTGGPWNGNRGTLELTEQDVGGWHRAYLNPDNIHVQGLVQGIDGGIITEMSFAFLIELGEWNEDFTVYRILRYNIDRGDVSAVNFGASPHTNITARAADLLDELEQLPAGAIAEAVRRLGARVGDYERILREADPGRLARIAEPALAAHVDAARVDMDDPEVAAAVNRIVDPEAILDPPDTKVIDSTPGGGPTVAGYEALLKQISGPS